MIKKTLAGTAAAIMLAATGYYSIGLVDAQTNRTAESVPGEQAIACINTALASQAGQVSGLDIEIKGGKTVCEVDIISQDGRKFDVDIDVAANSVIRTREDR